MKVEFSQVTIPNPIITDLAQWDNNIQFLKLLLVLGIVKSWANKLTTIYIHLPQLYTVDHAVIEFLPDWDYYVVDGLQLNVPKGEDMAIDLMSAIYSVKTLKKLGWKTVK